jgi:farnesyl diphosphate synthase
VLDVTGSAGDLGKTPGKDAAAGKATLVAALGLAGARDEAERLAEAARASARRAGCGAQSLALWLVQYVLERRS